MARRKSLMSWIISKVDPKAKADTLVGWVLDTVAPVARDKYGKKALAEQRQRIKRKPQPKRESVTREREAQRQVPVAPQNADVPRETRTGRVFRDMNATELQVIWMSPWEPDSIKEAALGEWMRIFPHPSDAGLGPAEWLAFREIYDGAELW